MSKKNTIRWRTMRVGRLWFASSAGFALTVCSSDNGSSYKWWVTSEPTQVQRAYDIANGTCPSGLMAKNRAARVVTTGRAQKTLEKLIAD